MGVYRVEYAKSARAGCQGPPCKKAGTKIGKGEMRFGTWVEIPGQPRGSFKWRHFGCVTDKVIMNMQSEYKKVENELDGFEDMTSEDGKKIKDAVERGHLLDEDKTPDNREPKPEQAADQSDAEEAKDGKTTKRKTKIEDNSPTAQEPSPKKVKAAPKKSTAKKATSSKKKKAASSSDEEDEAVLTESEEEAFTSEDEEEEIKPSKGKKSKQAAPAKKTPARRAATKAKSKITQPDSESE